MLKPFFKMSALSPLAALALMSAPTLADEEPLWEFGIGAGGITFPAYRGSDERSNWMLPVPYIMYRGEVLKADRDGLRGSFFDSDRIDLHVSAGGSIPVDSSDVEVREGMPDLRPTLEIGPALDIDVWRSRDRKLQVDLRIPVRYAVTVESSPHSAGWQLTPRIALDVFDPVGLQGWKLSVLAGPVYGSKQQHAYFYSVEDRYSTPSRSAYDAKGGYAGWQVLSSFSKRFPKFWIGGFVRYDSLQGAVFDNSPLLASSNYVAAGFGFAWIVAESSRKVRMEE